MTGARLRALAFRVASRGLPALAPAEWDSLIDGADVLGCDGIGCRTMRTSGGDRVVKEFALRRTLSSGLLRPHALRFVRACAELARRQIAAPLAEGPWRVDALARHAVIYPWREGIEMRERLASGTDAADAARAFGRFLARLHAAGVRFRSAHLGNFLATPDGACALLDCLDVSFREGPLGPGERGEMFEQALTRRPGDAALIERHAGPLLEAYLTTAALSPDASRRTLARLPRTLRGD